jgi:TM2 domain-containing membrane protein YozV
MDIQQIRQLLMLHADKFPIGTIDQIAQLVEEKNIDRQSVQIMLSQVKDPTISLILSVLVGTLGVDRFLIGDIGLGVGKLLTAGGCGIWWLIDIFMISNATKQKNYQNLMMQLGQMFR